MDGPVPPVAWRTLQVTSREGKVSTHVVPVEDFVHEAVADCVCGPWMVDGDASFLHHYALDVRYYQHD